MSLVPGQSAVVGPLGSDLSFCIVAIRNGYCRLTIDVESRSLVLAVGNDVFFRLGSSFGATKSVLSGAGLFP